MLINQLMTYGWPGLVLAAWIGLSVGSFLNVVIYRIPVMLDRRWNAEARAQLDLAEEPADSTPFNLMVPPSRCPQCNAGIRAWHNIPVFGWLLLRGRCHSCGKPISPRYPVVELLTGIATLWVLAVFGFTFVGYMACLYTWTLIALTGIDFDTQLLPDNMTLPLVWLGLLVNWHGGFVPLEDAVLGAVSGYLFLWLTYWGFKLLTGKEGMGYGDFKLFAAIGAWLGWQILPAAILVASVVGLIYALSGIFFRSRAAAQPIAFGPFLAIAGWVCMIYRDTVIDLFLAR